MNPRRILIAPDKFKGTLTAARAAEAMARGVERYSNDSSANDTSSPKVILRPLADGGEGSHDALLSLNAGPRGGNEYRETRENLPDAANRLISVPSLTDARGNHYLETALVVGLLLPGAREKSVSLRSTRGVGEWLRSRLIEEGRDVHLFLGGSATSDGGFGLARALGARFLRDEKEITEFVNVEDANRMEFPETPIAARVILHTDVNNPLTGPTGAARLFAGQKGAGAQEIEELEARLAHMLELFQKATRNRGEDSAEPPGTGAAGGLALPLLYWPGLEARVESGIDFFLNEAGLPGMFRENPPDLVLTGEGRTDRGTLEGKVVEGLRRLAHENGRIPCAVFSGIVQDRSELEAAGYRLLFGTDEFTGPFDMLAGEPAPGELETEAARRLEETVYRGLGRVLNP